MERALVVASKEQSVNAIRDVLIKARFSAVDSAVSDAAARVLVAERDYDLCVINAPLIDDFGGKLATDIASAGACQVVLIVKGELVDEITAQVEEYGVFALGRPLNQAMLWSVIKLAGAAHHKALRMHRQNSVLQSKLEDIKQISRAKCLLIEYLGMTEQQAHRHIEKQAMDTRMTRVEIANGIIRTYDN